MTIDRLNLPSNYIAYVRTWPEFADTGVLDNFPINGIILHDTNIEGHLSELGIINESITRIQIGTSMPGSIFLVAPTGEYPSFFIAEGLPGGSGAATLAAELYALGAENIVHIGLCALLGSNPESGIPILALGANKDSVATLLSNNEDNSSLARPSMELSNALLDAFKSTEKPLNVAYGYTTPVFYFQSSSLVENLISGSMTTEGEIMSYMEMEQAALFQTAKHMKRNAASIVIGSDRYLVVRGAVTHEFEDDFDQDELEREVLKFVIQAFV